MYKLLLIEDDKQLSEITREYMNDHGIYTEAIKNFSESMHVFDIFQPDIAIIDINLPYNDGFYLCKQIRKKSSIPIILISARDGVMEQVMGMEIGADDYIVKPYRLEILLAKVEALMRRSYDDFEPKKNQIVNIGKFMLDGNKFKMIYNNIEKELTKNEYMLLKRLVEEKDKVVNRDQLLLALWSNVDFVDDNTLTVNITRLKKKFQEMNLNEAIKTKRGIGYWLDTKVLLNHAI